MAEITHANALTEYTYQILELVGAINGQIGGGGQRYNLFWKLGAILLDGFSITDDKGVNEFYFQNTSGTNISLSDAYLEKTAFESMVNALLPSGCYCKLEKDLLDTNGYMIYLFNSPYDKIELVSPNAVPAVTVSNVIK